MKVSLWVLFILFSISFVGLKAQTNVVDEIVAVVGDEPILRSQVENEYQRLKYENNNLLGDAKCDILENFLIQNLLVTQAKFDSISVAEDQVISRVDQTISYYISQIGSRDKMEEYFGKKTPAIKEELMENVRNQMLTDKMKDEITKDIRVTPTQIRNYYSAIPKDSLPNIKTQYEIQVIYIKPIIEREEIDRVKTLLRSYQDRIKNGDNFSTLAILYSEDPGSRQNGGELGFMGKGQLVPEYANAAFNLKSPGDVSSVVETEFGFHIIQLIERRSNRVNTRHILIKPKESSESLERAKSEMDSIADLIKNDSISFENAALLFSQDKDTKNNGGLMSNSSTGSSMFDISQLNGEVAKAVENLNKGDVSSPFLMKTPKGQDVYAIVKLKSKIDGHVANLNDDYQTIKGLYSNEKKNEELNNWLREKQKETYISVDSKWKGCNFKHGDWAN